MNKYQYWVSLNKCSIYTPTKTAVAEPVPEEYFYGCLAEYLETPEGLNQVQNISFRDGKIRGWRQFVEAIKIEGMAVDGPKYLKDVRDIGSEYGLGDTYFYSGIFMVYEMHVGLIAQMFLSVGLALFAVFCVVIFITGSIQVTLLVILSVVLVDIYLFALIYFWGERINFLTLVCLVLGLGLSVDYSAHIAHTYLLVEGPADMDKGDKRIYKSRVALSQMGSSVAHGGMSTFLAVIVLAGARSYFFRLFFKSFFGIVVFGLLNGFILLPIILSFIGPTTEDTEKKEELQRRNTRRASRRASARQSGTGGGLPGLGADGLKELQKIASETDAGKGQEIEGDNEIAADQQQAK